MPKAPTAIHGGHGMAGRLRPLRRLAASVVAGAMLVGTARAQVDAVQIQDAFGTSWDKAAYIQAAENYYSAKYPDWNGYVTALAAGTNRFSLAGVKPCAALYRETGKAKYTQAVRAALLSITSGDDGAKIYTDMDFTYAYHQVRAAPELNAADRATIDAYLAARMNWLVAQEEDTTFVRGMMNATALAYAEILLLPGDPNAATWRARHEACWANNLLRVMDATEDASNYGPMWLSAMFEYVRVTAPRSGLTLEQFFNQAEIRNLCERNLRMANSTGFIPGFGGGGEYAKSGQMLGTFEALATLYQDGRYKDAAWRMMNFMRTAVDPQWFGPLNDICAIPVFDYTQDSLAPVAVLRPAVTAFDRILQGRAVPDKLVMETGGLAADSSLLVNFAQGYGHGQSGGSAIVSFLDQASPLLINPPMGKDDRVYHNLLMVRSAAENFPWVPATAGQLGQQYINDNIRRRFVFHLRGPNGNHGIALDPTRLIRLQIYLSGTLRDASNNSTFRLHIDNVRAVGSSGSLLLHAGQTVFPVQNWNALEFGGTRDLSAYDTVEFGLRIEPVGSGGVLTNILGFLNHENGNGSFFSTHAFDTCSLGRVIDRQSFARAQFSATEMQVKDTLGGDNLQRRDLLLAPGGMLLVRDRITFPAAQAGIQIGPVWNAAQVLSSGDHWYDLIQEKQQKLPQRALLAYFPVRTDGDTSITHGTAPEPASTRVVAYQKWSGEPAAGSTRTFNTLLLGHAPTVAAATLAGTVQTLRCDESATLVRIGGKFLLLNPEGIAINNGGLQTDGEVLYLETSGAGISHYSGARASYLSFAGNTIFNGAEHARFGSTQPVLTLPGDMTIYTRGNAGRVVHFGVGAGDHNDGPLVAICTPPSGSLFPVGSTRVDCSATNSLGQTSTGAFSITVVDENIPAPWATDDIGAVAPPGDATHREGTFHASGSGADIWGASDAFRFVHQAVTGNFDIRARVTGLANTHPWAKAGLMARENLAHDARNAMMLLSYANGTQFQWRTSPGGGTSGTVGSGADRVPKWLRLTRFGDLFTGYRSDDGLQWTQVGASRTITMAADTRIGLAVTSHQASVLNTATFTHVIALTGAPGFQAWMANYSPEPADPQDDLDRDGHANLLEFATGHLPNTPDGPIANLTKSGPTLEFTYRRSHAAVAAGVTFAVEWSATLSADWSSDGIIQSAVPDTDNGLSTLWKAILPTGTNQRFVRLKTTMPPS